MQFLNLPLGEFLALFGAVAAFSVALYLLDRHRRREVVATLRFWVTPGQPSPVTRRRKIQQPWSLLLQLLGMLLLLLAIAEFQFGGPTSIRRDHVIVLDTSAWMSAKSPDRAAATLMDLARADAIGWLGAVPSADRVMLIRADGLATPATGWESDRAHIIKAILESQPGATALNLSQSLIFASQLQRTAGAQGKSGAGEIVYVGPERLTAREANNLNLPTLNSLRVIAVNDDMPNIGLRSVGARRAAADPPASPGGDATAPAPAKDAWSVVARIHNYSNTQQAASVTLAFGKAPEGTRTVVVPPNGEQEATFEVPTRSAGLLEARLYPKDGFLPDNYAALEIPELRTAHAIVYSDQADRLRPAVTSDPRVTAEFHPTTQYKSDAAPPGTLVILDRFRPAVLPTGHVLWINPPAGVGPSPIKAVVAHPKEITWTSDQPVTAGLRVRDLQIDQASVFTPANGEVSLASIAEGPIMISSTSAGGNNRLVTIGFDPFAPALRYELSTPLLLANILRWMEPAVFRDIDVGTQSAGAVVSPDPGGNIRDIRDTKSNVQVLSESGVVLPFNVRDRQVEFFAGDSSRVRVVAGNSELVYSLTLPEMWDVKWKPPATARHGVPAANDSIRRNRDLWPFLALLGIASLLAEWFIYGRHAAAGLQTIKPRLEKVEQAA